MKQSFILILVGIGVGYCLGIIHQMLKQPPESPSIQICYVPDVPDDSQLEEPKEPENQIKDAPKPSRFNSFTSVITITTVNLETQNYAIRQAKELSKLIKSIPSVKDIAIEISANTKDKQYPIYP